jgi:RNA polymerase sigma-70 factor, ECF subfamily
MPSQGTVVEGPQTSRPTDATPKVASPFRINNNGLRIVSEEEAIRCIQASDRAFKDELAAIIPSLRSFARGLCGTRVLADELAGAALKRGWAERASFVPGTSFKSWIFRILRNHFYAAKRSTSRTERQDPGLAASVLPTAIREQDDIPAAGIARDLQSLPAEQREVLMLIVALEMPEAEVASVVSCTIGTVRSRLACGRKALIHAATH